MKEESMEDEKQKYHLYTDKAGVSVCSLYHGASGLSNAMRDLLIVFLEGWAPAGPSTTRSPWPL